MFKKAQIILINSLHSKNFLAIIFIIITVTALFMPAMSGRIGIFHDDQAMEEFSRYYFVALNLKQGIIPLWDPHTWCGAIPFYARYYADTYYMPLWPFYFLANLNNLTQAYWLLILLPLWLHYILAAIGMFLLLRRLLKCGYVASCLGAISYIYSPAFVYSYVWQQVVSVQTWLPWLLIVYVSAVEQWRLWKIIVGSVIFAFILTAGNPGLWHLVIFIWSSAFVYLTISSICSGKTKSIIKPLFIAFLIVIIGIGLSGVYLCPSLEGSLHTEEHIELTLASALKEKVGSLPPIFLATLFTPNLFGNITGANMKLLNPTYNFLFWEANLMGGLAVTLLVMLGMVSLLAIPKDSHKELRSRRRGWVIVFSTVYLFAILCVLGRHTPFYRYIIGSLPFINQILRPIRYRLLQCFAGAILIAVGFEHLVTSTLFVKTKNHLKRYVWSYIILSSFTVIMGLSYPFGIREEISFEWSERKTSSVDGYFSAGSSVGMFSTAHLVKKIGVFFDGESRGEIRYSNNIKEGEGTFIRDYYVPCKGWYEFDVNIPPDKYVWIYQKNSLARIGYKRLEEPDNSFWYDNSNKQWDTYPYSNSVWFYSEKRKVRSPLITKLSKKDAPVASVIISISYWLLISLMIIIGLYLLSPKRFGYFLSAIAIGEFFVFGMLAFYGGRYTFDKIQPSHVRALGPSSHPMLQRIVKPLVIDPTFRMATTQPYHDNFTRLKGYFALMGYEMHPLEKRFKRAIETAHGFPFNYDIYSNRPFPESKYRPFLNHFSVRYVMVMSKNQKEIFPHSKPSPLPGEPGYYIHINSDALPRAFTLDKLMAVSEKEQLTQLVSGDLRRAVYLDPAEGIKFKETGTIEDKNVPLHFETLQNVNHIERLRLRNPNQIDIEIKVTVPAMLVLTEVWYPGWKVTVNGKSRKVYRVNYCQRGVWLEKGSHKVRFYFQPKVWQWGAG
ncbi:MAG: hypothetical protein FJZ15_06090, partial [Candidatus Omnitrophica bacterium]|nr:hypothetical protein [Candidatus Omnitrophota bacterium]